MSSTQYYGEQSIKKITLGDSDAAGSTASLTYDGTNLKLGGTDMLVDKANNAVIAPWIFAPATGNKAFVGNGAESIGVTAAAETDLTGARFYMKADLAATPPTIGIYYHDGTIEKHVVSWSVPAA